MLVHDQPTDYLTIMPALTALNIELAIVALYYLADLSLKNFISRS